MSEPESNLTLTEIKNAMEQYGHFECEGICPECMKLISIFLLDSYPTANIVICGIGGAFGFSCILKKEK